MKKIFLLLLVPLIAIAFISCELDALSSFMGAVGSNVLVDQGLIQVDDSSAVNAANTLNEIIENLGGDLDAGKVASIKENIAEAVQSPQKKAKLKEEMSKPAPANIKDDLIPDGLDDDLKDFLDELLPEELTQGDVLAVVMARDLAEKMNDLPANPSEDKVMELVSDALQTIEIIKTVSSIDEVTIDALISDLLGNLTDGFKGVQSAASRNGGEDEEDFGDFIMMIAPLAQSIINASGVDANGNIDSAGLSRLIGSYKLMRSSYEKMAASIMRKNVDVALELDDLFNYLMSVIVTEVHTFLKLDDKTADYGPEVNLAMVLQELAELDPQSEDPPTFFESKTEKQWEDMAEKYAEGPNPGEGENYNPNAYISGVLETFGDTLSTLASKVEKGAINDLIDELIKEIEKEFTSDDGDGN